MEEVFFWSVPVDHPAFPGHFPGQPIVPGVVLLDQALHGIFQASGRTEAPCQIAACKFLSPVAPGEILRFAYRRQANGAIQFEISGNGPEPESEGEGEPDSRRVVATGKLTAPETGTETGSP